jgi:2-dehydro-3-deoxyphosphogalactonate aldolase
MATVTGLAHYRPPLIAILRGVRPDEAMEIGNALVDAGIRMLEVPLNSPGALASIERLAASVGKDVLLGAGTVLSAASVDDVASAGARFTVSPNTNAAVIVRALERGLEPMPGVMTPTEALAAIAAGARHLKVFPATSLGSGHIGALREVLPEDCSLWAVGGVNASNLGGWFDYGACGVGIGGSLYRAGRPAGEVRNRAADLIAAWRAIDLKRR